MTEDARFEDGGDGPLHLKAMSAEDVPVISALVQDAVFLCREMGWDAKRRHFALLLNRYRWEAPSGIRERVQSLLTFSDVLKVQSQGIDRKDGDLVLSLLSIELQPEADGMARVELVLAGDGGIALELEAIDVTLRDVTRPYKPVSGKAPYHPD